ncbi:hypothetical protein KJ359_006292 [Pestalotiopsis sp. 9143b]|nr:hypothetical protein KJ359_006292 [Pestalotiopsis sp. 9143b]
MEVIHAASLLGRDAIDDGVSNPLGDSLRVRSIIFVCISFAFVLLRLSTRYNYGRMIGADDAFIVGALILSICMTVTYNEEALNGFGLHTSQVSNDHKILAFKWFFAAQILYKAATCLTKLSICSLYLRIFPNNWFRRGVWLTMGITVAYTIGSIFTTIFSCNPIQKAWVKSMAGACLDSRSIWYATSIMVIITDLMIIILPINETRRLQLPLAQKLMLVALFSLGLFVVACTVVRMVSVSPQTTATDQIYYQAISNSWTFVETNVGIICACLPVVRVPVTHLFRRVGQTTRGTTKNSAASQSGFALQTVGQIPSRNHLSKDREKNGSVEALIEEQNFKKGDQSRIYHVPTNSIAPSDAESRYH